MDGQLTSVDNQSIRSSYGFPCSSVGKESACSAGDPDSIPGLGRRKWQPTPVFLLENPMDRGAWQATIHRVARVEHDLATKPPPPHVIWSSRRSLSHISYISSSHNCLKNMSTVNLCEFFHLFTFSVGSWRNQDVRCQKIPCFTTKNVFEKVS